MANQDGVLRRAISIIAEPARSRGVVPSGRSAVGQALIGHPQALIVAGMTRIFHRRGGDPGGHESKPGTPPGAFGSQSNST